MSSSGPEHPSLVRVTGAQLCVPVAAAVDGQFGDTAAAHLTQQDLAVGQLLAVFLVTADELGDEAGHRWDGAHDRDLGAIRRVAAQPGRERVPTSELEPPERRMAVEDDVLDEHIADVDSSKDVGE